MGEKGHNVMWDTESASRPRYIFWEMILVFLWTQPQ